MAVMPVPHWMPSHGMLRPTATPCRRSVPSMAAAGLAVLWAGQTASRLFCRRSPLLDGQQSCVLYPCLLMYSSFALLSLY